MIDTSEIIISEQHYYASGETRLSTGNMFTDKLFTGQRQMAGLGIYQFGARFYSPELGHFLSADPMGQNIAVPQAFNRYSYALNNPVRYTDPTGYWIDEGCGTGGGGGGTGSNLPSSGSSNTGSGGSGGGGDGGGDGGGSGGSSSAPSGLSITYLNSTINALYATSALTILPLPPSPFACEWFDCALSVASAILSVGTMVPDFAVPAFWADVAVTAVAYIDTEDAYSRGKISNVNRWALNGTGILGAVPGPFGLGLSIMNMVVTFSGYPH